MPFHETGSTPVPSASRLWSRSYFSATAVLLCSSVLVALTGGGQFSAASLAISVTRGWRLATIAFAIWLVGLIWDRSDRFRFLVLVPLVGLLISLAADSKPQRVGDSHEYVAMARGIAQLDGPARPLDAVTGSARTDWNEPAPEFSLVVASLQGADGRFDFPHFWFYPALAAPLVRLADVLDLHVRWAFFGINLALLLGAAAMLRARLAPAGVVLLVGSPVVWWIDKAHTEVFTWSLVAIAVAALRTAPGWSLAALGIAATQNPPFVVVLALTLAWVTLVQRTTTRGVWVGLAVGVAAAALAPLYYQWRLGIWSSLLLGAVPHWPSTAEFTAVLLDPNVGILANDPLLFVVLIATLVLLVARRRDFAWRATGVYALVVGIAFLAIFSQAANVNSGGTPNPSRYGVWLTALVVPAAMLIERSSQTLMKILANIGLSWSLVFFHPHLGDHYLRPTEAASWLWGSWPAADNPLPEVFCERLTGHEGTQELPLATPTCSKVLLAGAGRGGVEWPAGCPGGEAPPWCRHRDALCYANRTSAGWQFVKVPDQAGFQFRLAGPRSAR